jgi:hypothetical protein
MSFGDFLGMGEKHHPNPVGGSQIRCVQGWRCHQSKKKQLQGSPNYDIDSEIEWTPEYGRTVESYYKAPTY